MVHNRQELTGRCSLLIALVVCCALSLLVVADSRTFDVRETVTFVNDGPGMCDRLKVVVGLFRDWPPYIEVLSEEISPSSYRITYDEFGNRFAEFEFRDIARGEHIPVTIDWWIRVEALAFDLEACDGSDVPADLDRWIEDEPFIESAHPLLVSLAHDLACAGRTPCQAVEAIYDFVISSIAYEGYIADPQGALHSLQTGQGDCTEFAALMTALCRAAGIPARMIEGVTNRAGDEVHNWMEAYLPGLGWVPFDPTWGRHPGAREAYLAAMTPDHIPLVIGIDLNAFGGYSYWAYWYWWESEQTSISTTGYDWSVR